MFLDESVGGDIKLLPGLLRGVQGERERLQDQVCLESAFISLSSERVKTKT